jgi:response regulator NasT
MDDSGLRILAADEDEAALRETAAVLERLGHRVTAFAVDVAAAAERVASEEPDVSVVVVHRDERHALELISELNAYASGPVIALVPGDDPDFMRRAAECGVDGYARQGSPGALQSAIEVAVRRFGESATLADRVDRLEGALNRRAVIERAKGMLMERHGLDERTAFERLRSHARSNNRTVVDVARGVADGGPAPG